MGLSLGSVTGMLGIDEVIGGITGTTEAAAAAERGQREAAAASERSTEKQLEFLREQKASQRADIFALGRMMTGAGATAAQQQRQFLGQGYDAALAAYGGLPSMDVDVTQDPSYQFRLQQGLGAIESSAAARGMQLSGRTLRGLQDYAQDFASQEYGRAFQRNLQQYDRAFSLAGARSGLQAQRGLGMAGTVYDPSQVYSQQMGGLSGVGSQFMQQGAGTLASLGQAQAQAAQNIGAIQAQAATAPFQNLLSLGMMGGGLMSGAGAMGMTI